MQIVKVHNVNLTQNLSVWYKYFPLRRVVIPCRRFGTTYRSHLNGLFDSLKMDLYVVPKRR
jgi:hypothetical protein